MWPQFQSLINIVNNVCSPRCCLKVSPDKHGYIKLLAWHNQWMASFFWALWLPVPTKVSTVVMVFIGLCEHSNLILFTSGKCSRCWFRWNLLILVCYLSDCIVDPLFDQFMCVWLYFLLHWAQSHSHWCVMFHFMTTLVVISFQVLRAAHFLNIVLVRDTFASYYNSNYVVWHRPLRLLVRLFPSSKHTFIGFWLCMTTAFGSVKGFHSHALPPRKNKSSSQKKMARLGSDPAGCL